VGARTVAALAHVAEVVHGAPARFADPARFSMAHGGKDGHPFPVPLAVYDQTLRVLKQAVATARLGNTDRLVAIRELDRQARLLERAAEPRQRASRHAADEFHTFIENERARSSEYGGR
jgi:hypothetical protein